MDRLPIELLVNIVECLTDSADLMSARLACPALCDAVRLLYRPAQWPKDATASLPWRPSKLQLTHYTPADALLSGTVTVISHHNRYSFVNVRTLTLENIYMDMDLSACIQLKKLTLSCNVTVDVYVALPPNVEDLALYDLTGSVEPCTQLKTFLAQSCTLAGWPQISTVETCKLTRMHIPYPDYLRDIPNLTLRMCTMEPIAELNGTYIALNNMMWLQLPTMPLAMPNVQELELICSYLPIIRRVDLDRCERLTLFFEQPPGRFNLSNWSALKELQINFSFQEQPLALGAGTPTHAYQLPDMPMLETLKLSNCSFLLPVHAPNLVLLMILRTREIREVSGYPKLKVLFCHDACRHVVIQDLPVLMEMNGIFTQHGVSLRSFQALQRLQLHNKQQVPVRFVLREMPNIIKVTMHNIVLQNLHFLAQARELNFENCTLEAPLLACLANVPSVSFENCACIDNASPFARARYVDLTSTNVTDVSMLSNVRELRLANCRLTDWRFLHALHTLYIDHSNVVDLSPLAHHDYLTFLSCCNTNIVDLRPLCTIPTLRTVVASHCLGITDANALSDVAHIDLSDCFHLTGVRELGAACDIDLRGCIAVRGQDVLFLRETVPFVHWEDADLTETDEEMFFENDGDQH